MAFNLLFNPFSDAFWIPWGSFLRFFRSQGHVWKVSIFKVGQRDPRIQAMCPGGGKNVCPRGPNLQPTNYRWQIANSKMKYEDASCKCHVNETSKMQRACTCRWKLEDEIVDGTFISSFAAWWPLKGPADFKNVTPGKAFDISRKHLQHI